jgi:hypothetical protein
MTAQVNGVHMAALKAFLTDDDAAFEAIGALLDEDGSWPGYGILQGAALAVAARRRFPDGYRAKDVIRFVGRMRTALHDETGQIDPGTAERLLRGVLADPGHAAGLDQNAAALAMMALLKALVAEERLSGPELDMFVSESRDEAMRRRPSGRGRERPQVI